MQHVNKQSDHLEAVASADISIARIPEEAYAALLDIFYHKYRFHNGQEMRIANYFVKINRSLAQQFVGFINEVSDLITQSSFSAPLLPEGFKPAESNLVTTELNRGFTFGSFDMAVTETGLQNIEFQAVATVPITSAVLSQYILDQHLAENASTFADSRHTTFADFRQLYETIIGGGEKEGIILTDIRLHKDRTNFEFYATEQELRIPIQLLEVEDIYEKNGALFYDSAQGLPQKISRFYSRVNGREAFMDDNYPFDTQMWRFRYDRNYSALKFINHPVKQFEVCKRLLPYIRHPFNPACYELSAVADDFRRGTLQFGDYVWKHKWGAAGNGLILSPSLAVLNEIADGTHNYIAQKKVHYKIFKTDDGQEKIIELRFMPAKYEDKNIIVPMARLGHVSQDALGRDVFRIHFGDNNKAGYGLAPVVIIND